MAVLAPETAASTTLPDPAAPPQALAGAVVSGVKLAQQMPNAHPPRPTVDSKTIDWVANWWQTTEKLPHIDLAIRAHECCQQILHPAWFDEKDPWKGRALKEQQTRRSKREVRTPLVFLNNQQNTAQAVPETHDVKWKPDELADSKRIGADPQTKLFAESVRSVVKKYTREINIQDTLEAVVQDAHNFPMGVLKVHFERDLTREPLKNGVEQDSQDNLARIEQLSQDIARGVIPTSDRRTIELQDLLNALGKKPEIKVREGLVVQNLDMRGIRFPKLADLESIYLSPWISHEDMKAKKNLRSAFPFKVTGKDDEGNMTWEGIHPEDLEAASPCAGARTDFIRKQRDRSAPSSAAATNGVTSMAGNQSRQTNDENTELLTREVWDRESGYVYVFVEGVPYPAAKWVPERTPEQWYPFVFLVLNRVFGQVVGIADSELQGDTQARIHQKQTDLEVARDKCKPKGIIDSSMMDPKNVGNIIDFEGYSFKPMNLGGKGFEQMVKTFEFKLDPTQFDTSSDFVDLSRTAALPSQATGGTGGPDAPKFAKEVEVAAAGSAISSTFRNNRIRRFLDRFYDVCGQLCLWEVNREAAMAVDPTVFWPDLYTDEDADDAYQQIQQEVRAQVVHEVIRRMAPVDPLTGIADPSRIDPRAIARKTAEASQPIIEQRCLDQYGMPRPLSRKSMYRQLRVRVSVVLDGELDRRQRLRALLSGLEAIAAVMSGSAQAGLVCDWKPLFRLITKLGGADEDLAEEMFSLDANAAAAQLIQAVSDGSQLTPETLAALQQLAVEFAGQQPAMPGDPAAAPAPSPQGGAAPASPAPAAPVPQGQAA